MPNSRVRVKVPLDEALNYFIDYYNKVYDKKTGSVLSEGFDIALYNFLGARLSYRNRIKNLRNYRYVVYVKAYKKDYSLGIREPRQDEKPTYLSNTQIETLECLLEYLNTHITDIKKSYNSLQKKQLFSLLLFIIFVIALVLYSTR